MSAKRVAALTLVAMFGWSAASSAAGTAAAGQSKAAACMACHGVDGNSVNPEWPSLAGQNASYTVRQLKAFRSGQRSNVLMSPMAAALSDQDIEDLAAWYASQRNTGGETDPSKLEQGQRVYRSGNLQKHVPSCAGCHGPDGRGNDPAGYASLKGQHATYVAAQLRAYRSGERSTDPNQMMRDVASMLSDEEIDAVASYVQGLR